MEGFPMGKERIQAMIALQMLVGVVFIFMGVTKLADKFVHAVPDSVKGGILLAAPVTVMAGQLGEGGNMHKYPLAIVAGVGLLILISFSDKYQEKRKTNKFLDLVARYGNLFPYLIAMVVGLLVGELDKPGLEIGTFIKIPQFKEIIDQVSILVWVSRRFLCILRLYHLRWYAMLSHLVILSQQKPWLQKHDRLVMMNTLISIPAAPI